MTVSLIQNKQYKQWLAVVKDQIRRAQLKAATAVNTSLIQFYWKLGRDICLKQQENNWGTGIIDQLSIDLKKEFPDSDGFSRTNLYYIKQFYLFYSQAVIVQQPVGQLALPDYADDKALILPVSENQWNESKFVQQLVGQIPWGHHVLIIAKVKKPKDAIFYLHQTIENNWSRNMLALHIDRKLHKRQGKAITNFKTTLPKPQSDLAIQTLKNPYTFDFITLWKDASEKDIEQHLTKYITQFLLELGHGFAFIGSQYPISVGKKEFKLDLLFYHTRLRCYVVIELKAGEFQPEHAGKLNFYLSAVDTSLKHETDNPSIGILLCQSKNSIEVEYALRDVKKPIGVSGFKFLEKLPKKLQGSMPSVKELEAELTRFIKQQRKAKATKKRK